MFDVVLSPTAEAFYANSDRILAKKLARCFAQLESDPRRHNNIKRLKGEFAGLFRYRVGDWRVIFRIDETASRVLVLAVAHRKDIYE
ncbi:MAG TPA: type II toxin-antitoxin system RelE/ParE family toxin [Gemmataceae bacterium]|nr:type II toxin-antitoxin system RelE/ParE family toxin [Gemmataceae bacterium]